MKTFILALLLSLPFFWGGNIFQKNLEDFFFWQKIANNPYLLTAQVASEEQIEALKPIRNFEVGGLEIEAKSGISVFLSNQGFERILFEKESREKFPIASLTKLMTAETVLENYDLSQEIKISEKAVYQDEDAGNLRVGEVFTAKELLYPMLIESSNGAAFALSEIIGEESFVDLMNLEAENLGMENTYFLNPTGLDPKSSKSRANYSTTEDLIKLARRLLETKPITWEISAEKEFNLSTSDGIFHHKLTNTNKLLGEIPGIVGGKTGETYLASGCLILIVKAPKEKGYLINVILGSENRFEDMEKLLNWVETAYKW